MCSRFVYYVLLVGMIACQAVPTKNKVLKSQIAYFECVEKVLIAEEYYEELLAFREYLEQENVVKQDSGRSYMILVNDIMDKKPEVERVVTAYPFSLDYQMSSSVEISCAKTVKEQTAVDSITFYLENLDFDKAVRLSKELLTELEGAVTNTNGFQLNLLRATYKLYQQRKIDDLMSIDIYVTTDSLWVEHEPTTLDSLASDLTKQLQERRHLLTTHSIYNEPTIAMRVDGNVKMGRVAAIKAILRNIEWK